jgi:hypothetical protein
VREERGGPGHHFDVHHSRHFDDQEELDFGLEEDLDLGFYGSFASQEDHHEEESCG